MDGDLKDGAGFQFDRAVAVHGFHSVTDDIQERLLQLLLFHFEIRNTGVIIPFNLDSRWQFHLHQTAYLLQYRMDVVYLMPSGTLRPQQAIHQIP